MNSHDHTRHGKWFAYGLHLSVTLLTLGWRNARANDPSPGDYCGRIVCYFSNQAQYRKGLGKQTPEDLDPFLCTHIIFSYARLDGNRLAATEPNDKETKRDLGNYKKVTQLKKKNPKLKVLLAVGGWLMGPIPFTFMVSTFQNRKEFIDTSITFLRDRSFDGLSIDWEYPATWGSPAEDKARFSKLLKELRAAFDREAAQTGKPRLLLTATVSTSTTIVEGGYEVPVLNSQLDFINLKSYNFFGHWEPITRHHSPLYPGSWEDGVNSFWNVDYVVNQWIYKGASPEKLVIGVAFYGRSFRLSNVSDRGLGASASGVGNRGEYTGFDGFLAYYEICDLFKRTSIKRYSNFEQLVPYAVLGDQWIGYDDEKSMWYRVYYVISRHYGGLMVWDLSQDDFHGAFCGRGKYPLMRAINDKCEYFGHRLKTGKRAI